MSAYLEARRTCHRQTGAQRRSDLRRSLRLACRSATRTPQNPRSQSLTTHNVLTARLGRRVRPRATTKFTSSNEIAPTHPSLRSTSSRNATKGESHEDIDGYHVPRPTGQHRTKDGLLARRACCTLLRFQ